MMTTMPVDNTIEDPRRRSPLVLGHVEFGTVTEEICRVNEAPKPPMAWYVSLVISALAAGMLFGPVWGTVYSLGGASLGAALAFVVARYIAANWIAGHAGPRVSRIIDGVANEGWRFVAFTRLVPIFPYAPLNYFFGVSRIRFQHFILATVICMAPSSIAYSWLSHIGMEAASGRGDWVKFALLGLAALALIIFLPRVIKYFRK